MPGHLERSKYRKKRRGFPGTKKQFVVTENTHVSRSEPKIIQSPAKANKSFEKLNTNCLNLNEERNILLTRNKSFQLGIVNSSRQPIKANSNKIFSGEMLQDCISKAAICSRCKNPKSSLQLWQ